MLSTAAPALRPDLEFVPAEPYDVRKVILIRNRLGPVQEGNAIATHLWRFLILSSVVHLWHLGRDLAFEAAGALWRNPALE